MKKIEAIIRPERLDVIRATLEEAGCAGLMVTEIIGHGKQKGVVQQWRGEKYKVDLVPKLKIEVVVKEKDVQRIIKTICDVARTGVVGDGKIFISPIEDAVRIRTGESGETAL